MDHSSKHRTRSLNQCAALLADDDPQRFVPGRGVPLTVVNSEVFYPEVVFAPGVFFPRDGRKPDSNTAQDKFALWMLTGASHGCDVAVRLQRPVRGRPGEGRRV